MEYQPNPRSYWLEIDPENGNPTGQVCWAYYPDDRPIVGCWIKVTEESQTATYPKCPACGKDCYVHPPSGQTACVYPVCKNAHSISKAPANENMDGCILDDLTKIFAAGAEWQTKQTALAVTQYLFETATEAVATLRQGADIIRDELGDDDGEYDIVMEIAARLERAVSETAPTVSVKGDDCPKGECYASAHFEGSSEWEQRALDAEKDATRLRALVKDCFDYLASLEDGVPPGAPYIERFEQALGMGDWPKPKCVSRPDFHPPGCGDPKCGKCRKSYDPI